MGNLYKTQAKLGLVCGLLLAASLCCAEVKPEITTQPVSYRPLPTTGTLTAAQIGSGVWYQPEFDETSITETMQNLQRWGFRNLYLDTFTSGSTLFPSATFPSSAPAGRDWLNLITEKAHAHDLRVIASVHTLAWWSDAAEAAGTTHPLLSRNLDWFDLARDGTTTVSEEGLYYLSPSAPGVKDALTTLVQELLAYPVDGINFDYLHYNTADDFGYHASTVEAFELETGLVVAELEDDSDEYGRWVRFREEALTLLVHHLGQTVRAIGEERGERVIVSAAFSPGYLSTRGENRSYEYWLRWVARGYLDASTPLCFEMSPPGLERELREMRSSHQGSTVACVPGLMLAPRHPRYLDQRRMLESVGFLHCTISDYQTLLQEMQRLEARRNGEPDDEDETTSESEKRGLRKWWDNRFGD